MRFVATVVLGLGWAPLAGAQTSSAAQNVNGLFISTCVEFAGQTAAMRDMLVRRGVPRLAPQAQQMFLRGRSGIGFDATNQVTRLALVSEDNGTCSAFAARADGQETVTAFEGRLREGQVGFTQTANRANLQNPTLHVWHYLIERGGRRYQVVISHNRQPADVQLIMTLSPANQ